MSQEKHSPFRPDAVTQPNSPANEQFALDRFRAFALLPAFWLLVLLVVVAFALLLLRQTAVFTQTQAYYLEPAAAEPALAIPLPTELLSSFAVDQKVMLRLVSEDDPAETQIMQIVPAASGGAAEAGQWQNRLPTSPGTGYLIVAYPSQWAISQVTPHLLQLRLGQKSLFQILFSPAENSEG